MKNEIKKLVKLFDKNEKKKLLVLLIMMVVAALFETVGIGLIAPLIGLITNPSIIHEQALLKEIYELFNFKTTNMFIGFSVVGLLIIFLLKNVYILIFQYVQYKIILNQQVKLSRRLFTEYLTKSYAFHLQRNTAELLRNVNGEVPRVFQGIILSAFQLLTEILVTVSILVLLLLTSPTATMTASILLGGSIFIFFKFFRKKIKDLGVEQQRVGGEMIKWVNQGLGASKEVKVSGRESFFINSYANHSKTQAINNRYMKMLEQVPRLFIETLLVSVVLITMLIIVIQGTNTSELISTMALFSMAAFRLMPSINRIVAMATLIRYSQPSLTVIYEDLVNSKAEEANTISNRDSKGALINGEGKIFNNEIRLNNVSFRYPGQNDYSIKDVSLTIPIGQSAAFIGESGAGKTTLVDIILGLFKPEKGSVLVDERSLFSQKSLWQQKIGYIPQTIFLSDDTIRGNVAFGIEEGKVSDKEVWRTLEQAQLKDFVKALPDQLDTEVGERGVRLSGGQRQRIGIARALYHNPEILFMDEATSALDNETEKEIIKAIDGLKGEKTLIIIAHRLSTIENCDVVFKMSKGRLVATDNRLKKSVM